MTAGRAGATPRRWSVLLVVALLALTACGADPVAVAPGCLDAPQLLDGQTVVGVLDRSDFRLDGSFIDYYSIRLGAPRAVTIEMTSVSIDPFLYLWTERLGTPIAQSFDPSGAGSPRVARLARQLDPGCYRVGASTWHQGATGAYSIRAIFEDPGTFTD